MTHLSYSQLSTWLRCPKSYDFRYVKQAKPERVSMDMLLGSAVHDAITSEHQRRLEGHKPSLEYAQRALKEMLVARVSIAEAEVELGERTFLEWLEMGNGLIETYSQQAPVDQVVEIEKEFLIPIRGDRPLKGVIDFVVDRGDGPEVVELKTAGRSWSGLQVSLAPQATAYAWALGADRRPVKVTYVVLVKNKTPKVQVLETVRGPEDVKRLRELVGDISSGIRNGVMPRNMSVQTCSRCEYRDQCLGRAASAA